MGFLLLDSYSLIRAGCFTGSTDDAFIRVCDDDLVPLNLIDAHGTGAYTGLAEGAFLIVYRYSRHIRPLFKSVKFPAVG